MAVDIDLTNITRPEFGPAVFHQNMNVVKKKNRKSKGYVAPKVERDLTKVPAQSFNEDGEEMEPEFNVSQKFNPDDTRKTDGNNSDHENLF